STATPPRLAPVRNPIFGILGGCCAGTGAQTAMMERRQTAATSTREPAGFAAAARRAVDTPMVASASAMAQRVDRRYEACQAASHRRRRLTFPSLRRILLPVGSVVGRLVRLDRRCAMRRTAALWLVGILGAVGSVAAGIAWAQAPAAGGTIIFAA